MASSRSAFTSRVVVAAATAALAITQVVAAPLPPAFADGSKQDKVDRRQQIDEKLEDLKLQLDDVNGDLAQTYLDLAETELRIPQAQTDLEKARTAQREAEKKDRETGKRLTAAQEEEQRLSGEVESGQHDVDRSSEELSQVALQAYKRGGAPNPASVFIGSSSPQDAVDRSMNYRLTLASQGARLDELRTDQSQKVNAQDRLQAVRDEVAELKKQAEQAVQEKKDATTAAEKAKKDLDDLYATQKTQKADLEAKKKKYEGDRKNLEDEGTQLDAEIKRLSQEELRRERERESSGATGVDAPIASGGAWLRPTPGRVSSPFGWRIHPVYHYRKFHAGVDFAAACGVPVRAAHAGRVISRSVNAAAGNKIVLSHGFQNGKLMTSSYHHLSGYAKDVGAVVQAGDPVGYVGTTGASTGCHLHFEIHENGTNVDPLTYV